MSDHKLIFIAITSIVFWLQFAKVTCIFASEWPVSVSVFENNDALFYCEVRDKEATDHLVWFTDMDHTDNLITWNFANETTDLELDNNGGKHSIEYEVTPSNTYRLTYRIQGVQLTDEGVYACGYIPLPIPQAISLNNLLGDYATLQVLVPPNENKPTCTSDFTIITTSMDNNFEMPISLLCQMSGGRPAPELTWYRNNDEVSSAETEVNEITRILTPADNGVEFVCLARGESLQRDESCSFVPLQIQPTANLSVTSTIVNQGDNVTFTCEGHGLPFVSNFEWFINDVNLTEAEIVDFSISNTEFISQVTIFNAHLYRKHNSISCLVRVPSGLNSISTVTVSYVRETRPHLPILLLIITVSSGLLVVILIISVLICLRKQGQKDDDAIIGVEHGERSNPFGSYHNDAIDTEHGANSNPYQEDTSGEGYVINEIPGGSQRSATMGSDHPYATIQRDNDIYTISL